VTVELIEMVQYRHLITYSPADNCKEDTRCSPIPILPPDQVALAAPQYLHLVFHDVVRILSLVRTNYCATATSRLVVMTNYLLPARSSDDESTRLSKSLLATFSINDNIK
jgi:hypothetical protein